MRYLLLSTLLMMPACGPSRRVLKAENALLSSALKACELENAGLRTDIEKKNERLMKFNQLSEDGGLRPLKIWTGDVSKPVTGKESWQK